MVTVLMTWRGKLYNYHHASYYQVSLAVAWRQQRKFIIHGRLVRAIIISHILFDG